MEKKLDAGIRSEISERAGKAGELIKCLVPLLSDEIHSSLDENAYYAVRTLLLGAFSELERAKKFFDVR